jgi:hypothetical protein
MHVSCESLNWLLENSGPPIRYRTSTELLGETNEKKTELLKEDLLSSNLVQLWLDNLCPDSSKNVLHSGKSGAFENTMGKLYEFGLRKDVTVFDKKTEPFRLWLAKQIRLPNDGYFPVFHRAMVAAFLSMTGYFHDDPVKTMILKRLETIFPFAKKGDLNSVYTSQDFSPGFPKSFRNYPLLNPDLYPDDEMKLPWIHDVNAFLHSPFLMGDTELRRKVETIIAFILSPEYQKLHPGYGVIRKGPGRYYVMGWSIHLPGYFKSSVQPKDFGHFLLLLNLMSRSRTAREHPWFKRSFSFLDSFKTENDLVMFPRGFLPEKGFGYWVMGERMGLEPNRRTQKAIKCESTFRYLEIATRTTEKRFGDT